MKKLSKTIAFAVALLLIYVYVVVPLREYYSTPGVTVPGALVANTEELEPIQVIETEVLVLESIKSFKVEAARINMEVRDSRNNWDSLVFEWYESKSAWQWLWGRSVSLIGRGYVTASFDLSKVRRSDVTRDGDTFVVNVGSPNISHVVLPESGIANAQDPYQGGRVSAADLLRMRHDSELKLLHDLKQKACSQNILEQASTHIKTALPSFVSLTNGDKVRIRVETRAGECSA